MNLVQETGRTDLVIDRIKKCMEHYYCAVGIQCMLIGPDGKVLHCTPGDGYHRFCKRLQDTPSCRINCDHAHLYGSYQAERFGGKYVFFCPVGLVHWASPIVVDGVFKGAVLGGPVFMVDPEEFLMDEFILKDNIGGLNIDELKKLVRHVPVVQPKLVESMSELLFMVASHNSGTAFAQYIEDRELHQQQSDISEYVQEIKSGARESGTANYPFEKEKELLTLISLGDKAGAQKVLNEIFGHIFFSAGGDFEVIKARVMELIVLLSRAAMEGGADAEQIFGLNYRYLQEIHSFGNIDELTFWLSKIMARFTDYVFNLAHVKHVDIIYKAVNFVKQNYMRKITLEEVASHVYLSPSYFSKIFKKEVGCSFNTYLNKVRIEMSKRLLLDENIPLVDIASLAGYEDQSYFGKVFKKMTGLSPGKYRESRGGKKGVTV